MNYPSLAHLSVMAKLKRQAQALLEKRVARAKILRLEKDDQGRLSVIYFIDKTDKHGVQRKAVVDYVEDNVALNLGD